MSDAIERLMPKTTGRSRYPEPKRDAQGRTYSDRRKQASEAVRSGLVRVSYAIEVDGVLVTKRSEIPVAKYTSLGTLEAKIVRAVLDSLEAADEDVELRFFFEPQAVDNRLACPCCGAKQPYATPENPYCDDCDRDTCGHHDLGS